MLIPGSKIRIVDNSGAKICKCIKVLKQGSKTRAGDRAIVSLRKVTRRHIPKGQKKEQVKKGEIRLALIIQTTQPICRKDGTLLKLFRNYALLITTKNKVTRLIGSRFRKPLPKEIKADYLKKILNIAPVLF
jgi:large subunit ribosomal protein L14